MSEGGDPGDDKRNLFSLREAAERLAPHAPGENRVGGGVLSSVLLIVSAGS